MCNKKQLQCRLEYNYNLTLKRPILEKSDTYHWHLWRKHKYQTVVLFFICLCCRLWNSQKDFQQKTFAKSAYLWQLRAAGLSRCSELCPTTFSRSRHQSSPLHSFWIWLLHTVITQMIITLKGCIKHRNTVYNEVLIVPYVKLLFAYLAFLTWCLCRWFGDYLECYFYNSNSRLSWKQVGKWKLV